MLFQLYLTQEILLTDTIKSIISTTVVRPWNPQIFLDVYNLKFVGNTFDLPINVAIETVNILICYILNLYLWFVDVFAHNNYVYIK